MEDSVETIKNVECPRCGSLEFAIEDHPGQGTVSRQWIVCRNCSRKAGEMIPDVGA